MPSTAAISALCIDYFDTLATHRDRPPRLGELLGMPDAFDEVWRHWGHRRMTEHVPFEALLEELFRVAGRRPPPDVLASVVEERRSRQAQLLLEPEPSVLEMLKACRDLGLRIAVVSNAAVEDLAAWPRSPFADLVDETVFSWEVGAVKPDPVIYDAALERVGAEPTQAVFVSDSVTDLDGASRAGFGAVFHATWFRSYDHSGRYPIVETTDQLPEMLRPLT